MKLEAPYVGLDYFAEEDAGLFFGRDDERKRIIGNLRASRLTLLYAESGVGKSSLLRAGVAARLRKASARSGSAPHITVVFSAWRGDPTAGLISALERSSRLFLGDDADAEVRHDVLEHALEDVTGVLGVTPLLILDQFEEHLLYAQDGDDFDDDLARCITRGDLRANFLISVREDAYPLLGPRFKARIPNLYGNYLHLDFLDVGAARQAVVEPVRVFNERLEAGAPRVEVETALVDAVLDQVRRGRVTIGDGATDARLGRGARVETAYLQLVMKRLWDEEVSAGSHRLRLETLQRLGGADTIVHGHLDEVMATLPSDQRDAAAAAFRFLVTSSGRKIALSTDELREFSDTAPEALEPALARLEVARILRPVPPPEADAAPQREIYHDVLAPAILDWRRRHLEEQRRAENERRLAQAYGRTRRLEARNRRLAAAVVALTALVVGLALYVWHPEPVQRLELRTVDARYSLRGAGPADPRVVLIAVDDRTLARLDREGSGRLPRAAYARMLERLRPLRPAVIALDVIFAGAREPRGDRALLDAFAAAGDRVVLAFDAFAVVMRDDGRKALRPDLLGRPDAVRRTGVRTGFAGLPEDVDDHNRRADYTAHFVPDGPSAEANSASAPTFAFAVADGARGGNLSGRVDDLPKASRRAWGGQTDQTTWIDYQGPPGTFRRVSALDVLEGRAPSTALAGKVVVIGVIARENRDVHRTPLDRGRGMPGPEVQANAISTMLRDAPLRDASALVEIFVLILLACLAALAGLSRSARVGVALIVALAVAYLGAAQVAFQAGRVVAVVVPVAALLVAASGTAAVALARTLQRRSARTRVGRGASPAPS